MKKEFQVFASSIYDTKGLYRLIDQLSSVNKNLYHNMEGTIVTKARQFLSPNLMTIFGYLEEQGLEPSGDEAQKKFIEEIIDNLKTIPQVRLTLAFEPDDSFIARINDEISHQANQKIILDIIVNHHIVAGVVCEYQGKYKDYSQESKVDKYLSALVKKEEQSEVEA